MGNEVEENQEQVGDLEAADEAMPWAPQALSLEGNARKLQLRLQPHLPPRTSLQTDGVYGPETHQVLEQYARRVGLALDDAVTALLEREGTDDHNEPLIDVQAASSPVMAARFDANHRLWVLTAEGLFQYDTEPMVKHRSRAIRGVDHLDVNRGSGTISGLCHGPNGLILVDDQLRLAAHSLGEGVRIAGLDTRGRVVFMDGQNVVKVSTDGGSSQPYELGTSPTSPVVDVALSRNDVLFWTDQQRLYRTASGSSPSTVTHKSVELPAHSQGPTSRRILTLAADERLIAFLSNEGVTLYDTETLEHRRLGPWSSQASSCALSSDHRWLAVGLASGRLHVYKLSAERDDLTYSWQAHTAAVASIDFRVDDKRIATAGGDYSVKLWRFDVTPTAVPTLVCDLDHVEHPFGIARDIAGFARILLTRRLRPPISVGLFGDWGAGKSFFMEHLRKRIKAEAEAACAAKNRNEPCAWMGDIVQITFNAWHYVDTNLWVGLVTHLFDELSHLVRPEEAPAITRKALLTNLATSKAARDDAENRMEVATQHVAEAHERVAAHEAERDTLVQARLQLETSSLLRASLDRLKQKLPKGDRGVETAKHEVKVALDELNTEVKKLQSFSGRILATIRYLASWQNVAVLLGLVGALSFAGWLVDHFAHTQGCGWLGPVIGVVVSAHKVLRAARQRVDEAVAWLDKVTKPAIGLADDARAIQDQQRKQLVADVEGELAVARVELNATKAKLVEAEAQLTTASQAVVNATSDLEEASNGRTLFRFLSERGKTDDYRRHQGILGTIRRDFQELSKLVGVAPSPGDLPSSKPVANIDRIILYIDDLDRCPPARVVEVLEAVHLLLGMRLFCVVVAVDSRWLIRSLNEHYGKLLSAGTLPVRSSTPRQFLEKIFQIPFVIPRIEPETFKQLVRTLVPDEQSSESTAPIVSVVAAKKEDIVARSVAQADESEPTKFPEPPNGLMPRELTLTSAERKFIEELSPLLETPRAVKSLLNVYWILRGRLETPLPSEPTLIQYIQRGDYRAVLLLVALQIGMPDHSFVLFEGLLGADEVTSSRGLMAYLDSRVTPKMLTPSPAISRGWESLIKLVASLERTMPVPSHLAIYRQWIPTVRRFSFEPWLDLEWRPSASSP